MSGNALVDNLIKKFSRLPGLGARSARRAVLHLLTKARGDMLDLARALEQAATVIRPCAKCHNLTSEETCDICQNPARDRTSLCVVRDVADLWALERTRAYKGLYHILGGVLSAIDGVGPEQLDLAGLKARIAENGTREIILALGATVDGQATAHYITEMLKDTDVAVSRLAQGVPVGGELDYMDDGTLITALRARAKMKE